MHLEESSLEVLKKALSVLDSRFTWLPPFAAQSYDENTFSAIIMETAERLKNNYPYFHPLYAGQMLKPPHPVARIAYMLAMWINPNNHALDGGRESSAMEKEAVAEIASMFGWNTHLGHLTGGGTMANLEALWVAGKTNPGKKIVASDQAHYTHARISKVLCLPFSAITSSRFGKMSIDGLKKELDENAVGTVVATLGTTAVGAVDPLPEILKLRDQYKFRIHADCAYGGYFTLTNNLDSESRAAFDALTEVDSIVIDPHKHGLQPYGCGCVLFKDPAVGTLYNHASPYTYFSSNELHLGEISLECSRPGAAAVGLWATQKLLPLKKGGEFASGLTDGREAALALYERIANDTRFMVAFKPELDIIFWAPRAEKVSLASELSQKVFDESAKNNLHLALAELPVDYFDLTPYKMVRDKDTIKCLRSVLMKPEHKDWIESIWHILKSSVELVLLSQK